MVDEFFDFDDLLLVLEHDPRINRQLTTKINLLDSSNEVEKKFTMGIDLIKVTRENVHNYVRYISNASAFLSNVSTTFTPYNRSLRY